MSPQDILALLFTFVFVIWALYSLIATYHWFRYGRDSWMAVPAIGVHLFISGALMLYAVAGFK